MNFTKVIFRQIKRFKLIRSWFPERFANFYSVSVGEGTLCSVGVSPLQNDTESESITPYTASRYIREKNGPHEIANDVEIKILLTY